jgi:hypothetical protein
LYKIAKSTRRLPDPAHRNKPATQKALLFAFSPKLERVVASKYYNYNNLFWSSRDRAKGDAGTARRPFAVEDWGWGFPKVYRQPKEVGRKSQCRHPST